MVRLKHFLAGFVCCAVMVGCAGASFKYYGLDGQDFTHGKLLGPKPEDDLPFSACAPDDTTKNKCVLMFTTEFFRVKLDCEDTKNRLVSCERELQQCGRRGD